MTEHQKGYKAFFDDQPRDQTKPEEWLLGWDTASDDMQAASRQSYDSERFEIGYGDV